jgi:hypothetical protein
MMPGRWSKTAKNLQDWNLPNIIIIMKKLGQLVEIIKNPFNDL